MAPVVYMNKIERLKLILSFVDGKICDSGGHPVEMTERESFSKNLRVAPYVMDKYGNLYMDIDFWKSKSYLTQNNSGQIPGQIDTSVQSLFFSGRSRSRVRRSASYRVE